MYIRRKLLAIIILAQIILSLSSCAPTQEGGFLRVLELPARAKLEGERYGVGFEAVLTQSALDENGLREASLEFTAPAAFSGIRIDYSCGVWGVCLGDIAFSGFSAERLGAPIAAFSPEGEVISAEKVEGAAQTLIILKRNASVYEFIIDSKSGLPITVTEKTGTGEVIMEIKVRKYETK